MVVKILEEPPTTFSLAYFLICIFSFTHKRTYPLSDCIIIKNHARKLCFHFLSHRMGQDRGDSIIFDFEPNGILFGSKNLKENCHHDHIPFNSKGNGNMVFTVYRLTDMWSSFCSLSEIVFCFISI